MTKKADSADDDQSVIAFVTMVRDEIAYPAPHEAQVHPDEVKNYYSGGWLEKKDEAK
ncbi:TPA: hypothetical protein ACJIWH_004610 [Yersinia enterocolitica]|nr:hypothetical protein [Yersinia enterocolitica]